MFVEYLNEGREKIEYARLFDLIKSKLEAVTEILCIEEREEWLSKDLVVDTRETWKKWFVRQLNFDDPPLIPREDLPDEFQPHRSFYGKLSCFVNGIDPNPPADNTLR